MKRFSAGRILLGAGVPVTAMALAAMIALGGARRVQTQEPEQNQAAPQSQATPKASG